MSVFVPYKCPVCQQALALSLNTFSCENKHTFDRAREGYVNLHLVQHKRSKHPGDNAAMIASRRDFLSRGYYRALTEAITGWVGRSPLGWQQRLLDIGCGEGHYLQQLHDAGLAENGSLELAGIDVSKPAVRLSAKRKLGAQLAVINADALPFFERQFNTVLSVFAPLNVEEAARVLAPGGHLLMVGPGEHHLSTLAAHIYEQAMPHQGNYQILAETAAFSLIAEIEVKQEIAVQKGDVLNLLTMTPYYWHASETQQAALGQLESLVTTVHFYLKIYQVN